MEEDPLSNMRARAVQFRKFADLTHDREMSVNLRRWADEVEKDVKRLESRLDERHAGRG